jgi:hypothetical protein
MDYFKRLLEEACPNHAYPVRHKLKDCSMMRSFMTLGSLTWGAELGEGLDVSETMPFLEENAAMMVYRGHPHQGGTACLTQALEHQLVVVGDMAAQGCNGMSFSHIL